MSDVVSESPCCRNCARFWENSYCTLRCEIDPKVESMIPKREDDFCSQWLEKSAIPLEN